MGRHTLTLEVSALTIIFLPSLVPASPTIAPSPGNLTVLSCAFDDGLCEFQNTGTFKWGRISGRTPSYGTGPEADHTSGTGAYAYIEASVPNFPEKGPFCLEAALRQPGISDVSFWYTMNGLGTGSLSFDASRDGLSWTTHWMKSGDQGFPWQRAVVSVGDASVVHIRFSAFTGTDYAGDTSIDDVAVSQWSTISPTSTPVPSTSRSPLSSPTLAPSPSPTTAEVTTGPQLQAAMVPNGTVLLKNDIHLSSTVVISGQRGLVIDGRSTYEVSGQGVVQGFFITNQAEVSFCNLNITRSGGPGGWVGNGGGLQIISSLVVLSNVTISYCTSPAGGGVHVYDSRLYLFGCIIQNNNADEVGGILLSYRTRVEMTDTLLLSNIASSGYAGAVEVREGTTLVATRCEFLSNVANGGGGGAVYTHGGGKAMIFGTVFRGNKAFSSSGGAIAATSASVVNVTDSAIEFNTASGGTLANITSGSCSVIGDCIASPNFPAPYDNNDYCRIVILKDAILEEIAFDIQQSGGHEYVYIDGIEYTGGDIDVSPGTVIEFLSDAATVDTGFQFCTTENSDGGAIFATFGAVVSLVNSSVSHNSASSRGGGFFAGENAVVAIQDSTVNGNGASIGGGIYVDSASVIFESSTLELNSVGGDLYLLTGLFSGTEVSSATSRFDGPFVEAGVSCGSICSSGSYSACSQVSTASQCFINCGVCQQCIAGTYSTTDSSISADDCLPCPGGSISDRGSTECTACNAGSYASSDPTEAGGGQSFQVLAGAISCESTLLLFEAQL